jgi:hypothetical protein
MVMSDEIKEDAEPADLSRCAEALEDIAYQLTRLADLFEECTTELPYGENRRAVRNIPLTD